MKNLKKIILMSLIPLLITIFFIVQFTVPSVKEYFGLKKEIKAQNSAIKDLKTNLKALKTNKKLKNKLNSLKTDLMDFDVAFPQKFKDEILLIDLEIFADETVNKIVRVASLPQKKVEIIDPTKAEEKKPKRRITRSKKKAEEEQPPVTILRKPFEINTVAYYSEITDFVTFLEDYQRKVDIEGIYTSVFNEDKDNPNPKVELRIKGNVYKSVINEIQPIKPAKAENSSKQEQDI